MRELLPFTTENHSPAWVSVSRFSFALRCQVPHLETRIVKSIVKNTMT
eukprot:gene17714-23166_t